MADSLRTGLRALTAGVSVITMLGAAVVLVGWVFDLPTLKSLSPHWASMKVNTAIAFGLSGLSLWIQRHEGAAGSRRRVARFCGGFAALIGFLTMSEHAFRLDLGIDQALIPERHGTADTSAPGRMSPVTAVCFVAVGVALLFLDRRTPAGHRPAQSLALLPAVCGLLAVAGYLFGARSLYTLGDLTAMALPTATLFLALSQGILCARPDAGPLNVLVGEGSGSRMARRLLPLVITLPFLITSLAIMAERAGLVDPASGIALHAVGNICVFAGLLWMTAVWLNRADAQTKQAEHEVRAINAELEKRVRARTSALRAQAAQLEAANAELESFAYSVSHDLRSPLRAIDGFSQALGEDYADRLDATGRDYLGRIRAAAQRMGQLIDDLLNLSRVNRYVMEVKSVDLTALARDCAARLQEEASGRVIRFEIAESLSAQGDEKLLRIAFENLLGNAVKFTSRRHEALVEVGGSTRDGGSTFFVRDNGAGFDMGKATHLFGAFQRLHSSQEFPGTGIGLATVQRVVHRHGGQVWAEAEPEKGATFYIALPLQTETAS